MSARAMEDNLRPVGAETYSEAMADAENYIAWLLSAFEGEIEPPVLEIGVGHGSYASTLRRYGSYCGIDIDRRSVAEAQQRFPDLAFAVADITDRGFAQSLPIDRPRSIVCFNVLEHIPDHEVAVANLADALAPGGKLLVLVPALPALYNDLDRLAGHCRRYRRNELTELMRQAGLEVLRSDYFNPLGGLGWLANNLVRHRSLNDRAVNSQIELFDRWLVPISRLINPLTRRSFGQSAIAVGRKP